MTINSDLPLVSIVTPSFNQARFLEDTLRSVLSQDYPRLEYIVIDGGSIDGSVEIIARYADRLAYWESVPDRGQVDAINKGLRRARGEIVAWLNSDDLYMAGAVRQAVEALQAHPEAGMVYADGLMVDNQARLLDQHRYRGYSLLDLLCFEVLLQPTVFMRREVLESVGYLRPDFDLILDHDLWVRMVAERPAVHVSSFWAVERTHEEAKTIARAGAFVKEAERLLAEAEESELLAPMMRENRARIYASFHAFAARRLIDAGEYRQAATHFSRAMRIDPRVGLRYWYKGLQAGLSALGLAGLFLRYRSTRRRFQHQGRRVVVGDHGAVLRGDGE